MYRYFTGESGAEYSSLFYLSLLFHSVAPSTNVLLSLSLAVAHSAPAPSTSFRSCLLASLVEQGVA
uniref:Uncharacterized protein n=1 Tax=Anguilla anguilla TaxID=7936 RepID=A0A0E9WQY2_ANGAN